MLKQALITSALLLGSISQLSAIPCVNYENEGEHGEDFFFFVI